MAASGSTLLLLAVASMVAIPVALRARARARRSSATRTVLFLGSAVGLAAGLGLALWLPPRLPDTPGSPAMLVGVLALWFAGGSLALLSAATLLGAAVATPPASEPVSPESD